MRCIRFFIVLLLVIISSNCSEKENINGPVLLSEIIPGSWQVREAINVLDYGDYEWHRVAYIENEAIFTEENQYTYLYREELIEKAEYLVQDSDSTIQFLPPKNSTWFIESFDQNEFVVKRDTREGVEKYKYVRLD